MAKAEKKELLRAYLFVGDDKMKRDYMLSALMKRVASESDIEFNSATFTPQSGVAAYEIVDVCNTLPFGSDIRLVVIKEIDKFGKDVLDALTDYLDDPSPSTVLAIEGEKLNKNSRLYKALAKQGKNAVVDCETKKKWDLPDWVRSVAVRHGVTIAPKAAEQLVDMVGTDTVALDSELAKLAAIVKGENRGEITQKDVSAHVTRIAEVKPWDFADALSARDLGRCLTLLSRMPGQSPHALLAISVSRLRELITARSLARRPGAPPLATYLGVQDWRVKNHGRWAEGFEDGELSGFLRAAADAEKEMKSGSDPQFVFTTWVIQVCKGSRQVR